MVCTIIEKVDEKATQINLDQSKAFDWVYHSFLKVVLSAAGFRPHFCKWIHLLYASPGVMVEVNRVRSKPFTLTRSIHQGCPLLPILYVLALEPFLSKLKSELGPTWPHITWLHWDSQVHSLHWRCQHACYKQCQDGWGEQRNRKVQSCDGGQD